MRSDCKARKNTEGSISFYVVYRTTFFAGRSMGLSTKTETEVLMELYLIVSFTQITLFISVYPGRNLFLLPTCYLQPPSVPFTLSFAT